VFFYLRSKSSSPQAVYGRGTLYMKWRASSYMALGYFGDLDCHRASARAKWTTTSHLFS